MYNVWTVGRQILLIWKLSCKMVNNDLSWDVKQVQMYVNVYILQLAQSVYFSVKQRNCYPCTRRPLYAPHKKQFANKPSNFIEYYEWGVVIYAWVVWGVNPHCTLPIKFSGKYLVV